MSKLYVLLQDKKKVNVIRVLQFGTIHFFFLRCLFILLPLKANLTFKSFLFFKLNSLGVMIHFPSKNGINICKIKFSSCQTYNLIPIATLLTAKLQLEIKVLCLKVALISIPFSSSYFHTLSYCTPTSKFNCKVTYTLWRHW